MKNQSLSASGPLSRQSFPMQVDPDKVYRSIIDVVFAIDEYGIFQYVSPSCFHLFGYSSQEMTGASFLDFIHPDDIEKTIRIISERSHDSYTSNFENRYLKKDGQIIPVVWSGRWDEFDRLIYCVARDGSEKNELQQRLQKSQQIAKVANFEYDLIGQIFTYVSETFYQICGISPKDYPIIDLAAYLSLIHPDDLPYIRRKFYHHNPDLTFTTYRIIRPDGRLVYMNHQRELHFDSKGKPVKVIGVIQDVTDRKQVTLELQQREERFRFLVQNGNDILGIIDPEGRYIFVGDNVKEHLGYAAEEMIGRNAFEFIHPEDAPKATEALQQVANKKMVTLEPFRFINAAGNWRWIETTATNHLDHPSIKGLVVNSRDITEKKQNDDELKKADLERIKTEKRFQAMVQNGSDLIVILDEKSHISYISDNACQVIGYMPEELVGKNVLNLLHPDDKDVVVSELQAIVNKKSREKNSTEHRFLHKDGHWVWLESKGINHLDNPYIGGIQVNARNISDRIELQNRLNEELHLKQKEITSAVIRAQEIERSQLGLELHDNVNQVLTTVKLYHEMYLTGLVQDKELLVRSAQYTQDCINEIRSISKRLSAPTLGKISLEDSIRELIDSVNLTKRTRIQYLPEMIDQCTITEELHLAIYRIVQEGVTNIIKYSNAEKAWIHIQQENGMLCLKIIDNGKGFDIHQKNEGIGITNMKTRAENLNASFQLTSAPGKGCAIVIYFPDFSHTTNQ